MMRRIDANHKGSISSSGSSRGGVYDLCYEVKDLSRVAGGSGACLFRGMDPSPALYNGSASLSESELWSCYETCRTSAASPTSIQFA